jgi:hypothetical protein
MMDRDVNAPQHHGVRSACLTIGPTFLPLRCGPAPWGAT